MVSNQEVTDYLSKLPSTMTSAFNSFSIADQEKIMFAAHELLGDFYSLKRLTPRSLALQTLFMIESESEEYARLKRHGIGQMSTKDTSITFARTDALSPDVIAILGVPLSKGLTGRLI